MCKKLIYLILFMLVLSVAGNAMAQIDPATVTTGHVYLFDNVSGSQLQDDSANNNTGTIVGDPQVVDGLDSKALQFDGVDDGINIPDSANINTGGPWPNRTVIAVFQCADVTKQEKQTVFEEGGRTRGLTIYVFDGQVYVGGWNRDATQIDWNGTWISTPIESNSWYAVALVIRDGTNTVEPDKFEMWMDGNLIDTAPGSQIYGHTNDNAIGYTIENNVFHDDSGSGDGWYFEGVIDEIWVLNDALTETDLGTFRGKVWPYAWGPTPADGAMYEDTWLNLFWTPGGFAVSHDVYLGDNFDDVNDGAEGTFVGNQAGIELIIGFPGYPYPDGLVPGKTYYWRVDEVNDTDPNSPWKGDVWSFSVPPRTAYEPNPADGVKFAAPDVELNWTSGFRAKLHYVHFGDNFDDVNNAVVGLPQAETTFTPGTLEFEKVYYWRIDEFDGVATNKGDVWSFRTMPEIPITDPSLVGWWKLDEGMGTTAVDWSGHGNHGTLMGDPQWVPGFDGDALEFDGNGDYVDCGDSPALNITDEITVACWIKVVAFSKTWETIIAMGDDSYRMSRGPGTGDSIHFACDGTTGGNLNATTIVTDDTWRHVAVVYDGSNKIIYIDGAEDARVASTGPIDVSSYSLSIGENLDATGRHLTGLVDNVRIYNRALAPDEISQAMRGDPVLAWNPNPGNGSTPYIRNATPLSWSAGDNASQHDVYFGTDKNAVSDADASDTTGIYQGRQGGTIYSPPDVEWGSGPYYWRVDEYNTDATISKGNVWTFTVADSILIEDFEDYNDYPPDEIWNTWIDGYGIATNGSTAGHPDPIDPAAGEHYVETTIVHDGSQSMPLYYENNFKYSEATMTLVSVRDWTEEGVGVLSLWFYGDTSNAAERMYVALNGSAVVYHDNPDAALIDEWTPWTIDLQEFAAQGVNLANVNTIAIGFGDKNNLQAGGSGMVFFDDIRLYRPAPEPAP